MPPTKSGSAARPLRNGARPRLPGANPVTRHRADGTVALQWYASRDRGAPLIAEFTGSTLADALAAEREGAADLAQAYAASRDTARQRVVKDFASLILAFAASPDFKQRLAQSTQDEWSRVMKTLRASPLGSLSLRALASKGARGAFLDYRDALAATPRKADYHMQVASRTLRWGIDREYLTRSPLERIGKLYDNDRSGIVWTNTEIDAVCAHLSADAQNAIRFMALTGLRLGDAIKAPWSALDAAMGQLTVVTRKSGRRRAEQVCELTPDLAALLQQIPKRGVTILTTSHGKAWLAKGLGTSFRQARAKAGIEAADDGTAKRLHDIRGTTATAKVAKVLADPKFQREMGWSGRAARTAAKYVDTRNVVALSKPEENDG